MSAASSTPIPAASRPRIYAKVLADDTPLVVDILADILQNSVFDADELTRERAVVLQEIGQAEDTPDDIIFDHFQEIAFPDQAMGRPVLGRAEIVREPAARRSSPATWRAAIAPARWCWRPRAGSTTTRWSTWRMKLFSGLPSGAMPPSERARYHGGDGRFERELEQVHLVARLRRRHLHTIPTTMSRPSSSQLLGGGMSSRLFQEIREKRGLVYSIHSFSSSYSDGGIFGIYAGTGEKEVAELMPGGVRRACQAARRHERAGSEARRGPAARRHLDGAREAERALRAVGEPAPDLWPADPARRRRWRASMPSRSTTSRAWRKRLTFKSKPTLTALGPIGQVMEYDALRRRLS